jgi:hypothetical protein
MRMNHRTAPSTLFAFLASLIVVFGICAGTPASASPVTYRAKVFSDVKLGGVRYRNVDLTLTFVGDTSNVYSNSDPTAHLYDCNGIDHSQDTPELLTWITRGTATLQFESNGRQYTATFNAGQVFVSQHSFQGVGFGAFAGASCFEPIYPLAFTSGFAGQAGTSNSVLNSPTPVRVTGIALSCAGGYINDPAICLIEPPSIKTDHGDFAVYSQYFVPTTNDPEGNNYLGYIPPPGYFALDCHYECSLNHGMFSMTPGSASH